MNKQLRFRAILFDLDGTLTEPFTGIARSVNYALAQIGHPPLSDAELRDWIGPPLHASFERVLGDPALADQAVAHYRQRYWEIGMFENTVFPGIPELLRDLQAAGIRLFVATSKIRPPTERILAHFGLQSFFEAIAAVDPDDRDGNKAMVIATLLPQLGADRPWTVMVGDTIYDISGARSHRMPCIAVTYGYGAYQDLYLAAPLALARSVEALRELVL
ncbi:HAD hydrolase-like protein [Chloroflexus sp.]|uniref:HAD hydrolase-like protein n=1 Tax=Chloroflexus sp. TaxID=1904827 RepID=UPI00260199C9|nr:HAD hydrolase-like protein [uncultured Chloroflexus sp.]